MDGCSTTVNVTSPGKSKPLGGLSESDAKVSCSVLRGADLSNGIGLLGLSVVAQYLRLTNISFISIKVVY